MNVFWWSVLQDGVWSMVAAVGFALLFNVPRRTLPGCALAGATGHAVRFILLEQGMLIEPASLAGATAVGFLAAFLARRYYTPVSVFSIPGVIPLVPGTFAFRTMLGMLELANLGVSRGMAVFVETGINGIKTGLILATLAIGIAVPNLLFRRHRPVV